MPSTISSRRPGSSSSLSHKATAPFGHSLIHPTDSARKSTGTPRRSSSFKKLHRGKGRSGAPTLTFEESESTVFIDREMLKNHHMDATPSRRMPVRMDQDGPWSVSVAESPHDPHSYSLYIKTPTHHLTLTRTVMEIVELDQKLRDTIPPTSKLPAFPLDSSTLPAAPKRKSAFLNTLSRLASPTSNKSASRKPVTSSSNPPSVGPSGLPTPAASPSVEQNDPFLSFSATNALLNATLPAPSANSTALAAYLTTLSNSQAVRHARTWKRFVRVRTDDLESVRVERAIKRVRSDLAAHVGMKDRRDRDKENRTVEGESTDVSRSEDGTAETEIQDLTVEGDDAESTTIEAKEGEVNAEPVVSEPKAKTDESSPVADVKAAPAQPSTPADVVPSAAADVVDLSTPRVSEDEPRTPSASAPTSEAPASHRVPRSQSADPDHRLSRAYTSSVTEGTLSSSQTETGDESSSVSTAARSKSARKKRKASTTSSPLNGSSINKELAKRKSQRKVVVDDFEMLRVLGKGCAGKVLLVRHKATTDLYAMKAITKRHVLAHQELQHTLTEQAVLKRMAAVDENGNIHGSGVVKDPFVVKLWWSFHDKENLFLVMDFHPGGDLATQLARWGRLGRDRARFYAAEIVEGCEGLHAAGVIYRDLKPENILIGADGHIVLTDFGLSKEFPRRSNAITAPPTPSGTRGEFVGAQAPWMKNGPENGGEWSGQVNPGQTDMTSTFCGTAEYLAPEVIQGLPYSYEIDWWSFGTMLFEMLTGITPFWANNHSDMYVKVLQDELQFPDDRAIDQDTKSFIRGLLQRNPALRLREPRIKRHPYFSMIDWSHVYYKRYIPPYIPPIDPSNASDTQNFDDTFLDMEPVLDDVNDENTDTDQDQHTDTDRTDGEESNTTPSQSRSSSLRPRSGAEEEEESVDVFDGYSFKGRHSVLIDDEVEEEEESEDETPDEEEEDEEVSLSNLRPDLVSEKVSKIPADIEEQDEEEDVPEPKTPEARPKTLPPDDETAAPLTATPFREPPSLHSGEVPPATAPVTKEAEPKVRKSKDEAVPASTPAPEKETKSKPASFKPQPSKNNRAARPRKERSGVPALDRYLSDGVDEDAEVTERDDDEDDDWDFIEADGGEDRNGSKGTSLFARGVVDRYRLAVFRKASTPNRSGTIPRSVSGMSKDSEMTPSEVGDSPSPSMRRGRNPGLTFRKTPRQFLRPKSPPSSYSSRTSGTSKTMSPSHSGTISTTSSSAGIMTPSPSAGGSSMPSHSLKSKESAMSMGAHSYSSDTSGNGDFHPETLVEGPEKQKNKKLKKYKENAEKVFSIFSASPRQPTQS